MSNALCWITSTCTEESGECLGELTWKYFPDKIWRNNEDGAMFLECWAKYVAYMEKNGMDLLP